MVQRYSYTKRGNSMCPQPGPKPVELTEMINYLHSPRMNELDYANTIRRIWMVLTDSCLYASAPLRNRCTVLTVFVWTSTAPMHGI